MVRTSTDQRVELDLSGIDRRIIDTYHLDLLPTERPNRSTAELLDLRGKVALVTGGGGESLGNAICHRLAEAGATVAVLDIDGDTASSVAEDLARLWNVSASPFVANVGDWDDAHRAVEEVVARFGTVDILVNNAGGAGSVGADGQRASAGRLFADATREDLDITVAVNYVGVMYMTKAVLEVMLPQGHGRIINISSEGGKMGMVGLAAYNSCKAAIIGFTRNLATEVGPQGVSLVAVCPAIMVTDATLQQGHFGSSLDGPMGESFKRSSIGRASLPDEVASVVAFLASDAGAYVHGTAVSVGGGASDS